ncbi:MAG: hypothetical protein ABIR46_01440 [Candidatus Saccharimonadales bacterium]
MEYTKPHEIINRCFEARHNLRNHLALETMLIERIAELPEDDFCHFAREAFQIGTGYAQMLHEDSKLFDPSGYDSDYTAKILEGFFEIRPRNRYLRDYQILEYRKQIYEGVVSPELELPDHLDPYEVSAASHFLEGYLLVTAYHVSNAAGMEPDILSA